MSSPERTLVVGASGFLGMEIAHQLRETGADVIGTVHDGSVPVSGMKTVQYDFWSDDLETILDAEGIERVVFAATVERGNDRNRNSFEWGVDRVVTACRDHPSVYVSTDAVFDGEDGPYDEEAEPVPVSEYGRRARAFERAFLAGRSECCVVRPSYLYGFSDGMLDPRLAETRSRIRDGETVAYFEDAYKSPISVGDVAGIISELVHLDMTDIVHAAAPRMSIYGFHRRAMDTLDEPAQRVVPEPVPPDMEYPRDTSLASIRLESAVETEPSPIAEALEGAVS